MCGYSACRYLCIIYCLTPAEARTEHRTPVVVSCRVVLRGELGSSGRVASAFVC